MVLVQTFLKQLKVRLKINFWNIHLVSGSIRGLKNVITGDPIWSMEEKLVRFTINISSRSLIFRPALLLSILGMMR